MIILLKIAICDDACLIIDEMELILECYQVNTQAEIMWQTLTFGEASEGRTFGQKIRQEL